MRAYLFLPLATRHLSLATFLLFALAFSLAACGFEPIYATPDATQADATRPLLPVELAPPTAPTRRMAQQFHSELEDVIDPALARTPQPFTLLTGVGRVKTPVFIRPDGTIARYNITLVASYTLLRNADKAALASGSLRYINSYNVPDADYGEYVAEQDADRRGLQQLAEDLRLRLAGYFSRNDAASAAPVVAPTGPPPPALPAIRDPRAL